MAKRLPVRYLGRSHYSGMEHVPGGTEFKGVEYRDSKGKLFGVMIRGSNLVKAGANKDVFGNKEYYFSLGNGELASEFEVIK